MAPTLEVIALGAVKGSVALSTLPQPFSPQSNVPQPGNRTTVISPTLEVADCPAKVTDGASPYA